MELLRVLRKSVVFIAIFLGIIIWLSIFKINNTNDKKVYAYYNQLMYEYANQTEMIGSLTYSGMHMIKEMTTKLTGNILKKQ